MNWLTETVLQLSTPQADAGAADLALLTAIDERFRSSDRGIPAETLLSQAFPTLGPSLLGRLADLGRTRLLEIVDQAESLGLLEANRGVVENLLKIQRLVELTRALEPATDEHGDRVNGLSQDELDRLVATYPASSARREGEFDLRLHELRRLALREVLNNDLYNFKMAAGYFVSGKHLTHQTTFTLFSRGKKNRPFMLAVGQDQVLDLLENLRFTEREVRYLAEHPDFALVPTEFFEYLRGFRFRGTVRAVPVGTPVFANEPIVEVTGNAIEAQIVETLLLPIMNAMSHFATKAARVVHAADGRPVVEGGTRRGFSGLLSALSAYIAGTAGTSNAQIARIAGIPAYGSLAHAGITMETTELEAMRAYVQLFPSSTLLADTYDILDGVRNAVRAAGTRLSGIRLDSTLPGTDKGGTARAVRELLDTLGYERTPITFSDGLDEYELTDLPRDRAPFQSALVGTEIASPSDAGGLGMVYKLDQIALPGGEILDPMKFSNGKTSLPGQKQVFRFEKDGMLDHDVIAEREEPTPRGARALLELVMADGMRLTPRLTIAEQRETTRAQLAQLPNRLWSLTGQGIEPYAVLLSDKLKARQERAASKLKPARPRRVGVLVRSLVPGGHAQQAELARAARALYGLDKILMTDTPAQAEAMVADLRAGADIYVLGEKETQMHSHENRPVVTEAIDLPKVRERGAAPALVAIFHEVDVQKTFWKGMHGEQDGPLAVAGTPEITANIARLKQLSFSSDLIKQIASKDAHYPAEVKSAAVNAEFHPSPDGSFPGFPPHAMAGLDGPVGDSRIPEAEVYPKSWQLVIPHHREVDGKLELVPVDLDQLTDEVLDPRVEIVIEKNGQASYDVFMNPRAAQVYERINPDKRLPIYLYGVATDFCDKAAVLGLRAQGYEVHVITDAIAGVFPESTASALEEMRKAGAEFVTTDEVVARIARKRLHI